MPSLWKKTLSCAAAGGVALSHLVTGRRGGSLPVQTGFPTSLADLVVKNRNRLKNSSRKKKPSADSGSSSSPLSAAAASLPTPQTGADTSTRILGVDRRGVPVVVQSGSGSGSCDAEIRLPSPEIPGAREKSGFRIGCKMGFRVILILIFLAIERKTLISGITVFALGLWLLDSLGVQAFGFLKPCSEAQRRLNSVLRGTELEKRAQVSPIRESAGCPDLIHYERSSLEPILLHQGKNPMPESRDHVRTVAACPDQVPSSSKFVKPKKLFKKSMIKKLLGKTNDKAQCEQRSCPTGRRLSESIAQETEEIQEIEEDLDAQSSEEEPLLSSTASDRCVNFDIGNSEATQEHTYKTKPIGSRQLVCLVLILLGLLEGKSTALILTVSWVGFSIRLENMYKKRMSLVL